MISGPQSIYPARALRQEFQARTGLTLERIARRVRRHPRYLLRCEREGFAFDLAERLAEFYGCPERLAEFQHPRNLGVIPPPTTGRPNRGTRAPGRRMSPPARGRGKVSTQTK